MMQAGQSRLAVWRRDPSLFVEDVFRLKPDLWQQETLDALGNPAHPRISMQACAGPGKSAVLAWAGWWFMTCFGRPGNHPKGAAVSITEENLKDNLWAELQKWRSMSPFLTNTFEWNSERIYARDHPATWFLSAKSFPKSADVNKIGQTLSGMHSDYVLFLIDESGGIHPAILNSAEQALSNCVWGKILQAGNPISRDGCLYLASINGRWYVVRITGDPQDPKRSPRVGMEWAEEQIKLHGRDNAWVKAYILGEFPDTAFNALLGPDDVRKAMGLHLREDWYRFAQKRLGIDVARFGDDRTVIFPRQGRLAARPVIMRQADGPAVAGRLILAKTRFESEAEYIDDTGGWASAPIDFCRLAGHPLIPINMGGKPDDERYFNKRAEVHFRAAEWVKTGGALPNMEELVREACAATYFINRQGKLQVEEKDQIKKRLGFSPDLWDAFGLSFATPEAPGSRTRLGRPSHLPPPGVVAYDYNPDRESQGVDRARLMDDPYNREI